MTASHLVNSILQSVSGDFTLDECSPPGSLIASSPTSSTCSTSSSGYSSSSDDDEDRTSQTKCLTNGRDILDLYSNLTSKQFWCYKATVLPNKDLRMFLSNRSVYHRCGGHAVGISGVENCKRCGFPVPVVL